MLLNEKKNEPLRSALIQCLKTVTPEKAAQAHSRHTWLQNLRMGLTGERQNSAFPWLISSCLNFALLHAYRNEPPSSDGDDGIRPSGTLIATRLGLGRDRRLSRERGFFAADAASATTLLRCVPEFASKGTTSFDSGGSGTVDSGAVADGSGRRGAGEGASEAAGAGGRSMTPLSPNDSDRPRVRALKRRSGGHCLQGLHQTPTPQLLQTSADVQSTSGTCRSSTGVVWCGGCSSCTGGEWLHVQRCSGSRVALRNARSERQKKQRPQTPAGRLASLLGRARIAVLPVGHYPGGRPLGSGHQLPPPKTNCWPEVPWGGGGGGGLHWTGGEGRGNGGGGPGGAWGGGAPGGSVRGGGVQARRFGVVGGGGPGGVIWGVGRGGGAQAPLTSPCLPSDHIITINLTLTPLRPASLAMPAMLIGLNKIPQISFMAAFATSLLLILDPNTHSDPSLG